MRTVLCCEKEIVCHFFYWFLCLTDMFRKLHILENSVRDTILRNLQLTECQIQRVWLFAFLSLISLQFIIFILHYFCFVAFQVYWLLLLPSFYSFLSTSLFLQLGATLHLPDSSLQSSEIYVD